MASDEKVFVFGGDDPGPINIDGGPNDWDIWLNFRGTGVDEVTFFINRATTYPQFHPNNRRTFLPARILGINHAPEQSRQENWRLTGYTFAGQYRYYFEMWYNPQTRKGIVWFDNKGEKPK